ncbi:hypothetical protein Vafri_2097 [Volvox africanus]|nr:hypothetical protein Vafri_2097 [Volvox africanus]
MAFELSGCPLRLSSFHHHALRRLQTPIVPLSPPPFSSQMHPCVPPAVLPKLQNQHPCFHDAMPRSASSISATSAISSSLPANSLATAASRAASGPMCCAARQRARAERKAKLWGCSLLASS